MFQVLTSVYLTWHNFLMNARGHSRKQQDMADSTLACVLLIVSYQYTVKAKIMFIFIFDLVYVLE